MHHIFCISLYGTLESVTVLQHLRHCHDIIIIIIICSFCTNCLLLSYYVLCIVVSRTFSFDVVFLLLNKPLG